MLSHCHCTCTLNICLGRMHPYLPTIKLFFCEPSRSFPILAHSLFQVFFYELCDGVKHLENLRETLRSPLSVCGKKKHFIRVLKVLHGEEAGLFFQMKLFLPRSHSIYFAKTLYAANIVKYFMKR